MTFPAHSISPLRLSPLVIHSNFSTLFSSMDQYKKLGPQPSPSFSKFGSCNMAKWVFASSMGSRNNGCLVGVRCEALADDHGFYMRRCVELARKAVGCTSPNPMVGCVIVKDGKIVGEGFHPKAGQPHAEVFALRDAGDLAENGTAYVSLEPCNHYGRTPPCTEALIKAKVKKVVVGMVDPNPIVASKGVARLRDAGITVLVGVEEQLCRKLNEAFICRMLTGMPFLTMRYSLSVNGRLLDQLGEGAAESGGYHSQLLQEYDAVILSSTSLANNHLLPASKEPGANRPLNIIVGKGHTLPTQIPIYTGDAASKAIIFTDKETVVEPKAVQKGIETVILSDLNISTILEHCKDQGLCSVLLDIRGSCGEFEDLIRGCLEQHLVQKVVVEVLPIWNGGKQELLDTTFKNLGQTNRLKNLTSRVSGGSVLLEGYL